MRQLGARAAVRAAVKAVVARAAGGGWLAARAAARAMAGGEGSGEGGGCEGGERGGAEGRGEGGGGAAGRGGVDSADSSGGQAQRGRERVGGGGTRAGARMATQRQAIPSPTPDRVWLARHRQPEPRAGIGGGCSWVARRLAQVCPQRGGRERETEREGDTCSMRTGLCSGGSLRTSWLCTQLCGAELPSASSYCTRHLSCLTSSSLAR